MILHALADDLVPVLDALADAAARLDAIDAAGATGINLHAARLATIAAHRLAEDMHDALRRGGERTTADDGWTYSGNALWLTDAHDKLRRAVAWIEGDGA